MTVTPRGKRILRETPEKSNKDKIRIAVKRAKNSARVVKRMQQARAKACD